MRIQAEVEPKQFNENHAIEGGPPVPANKEQKDILLYAKLKEQTK
jgi:hypothetical protein